MPMETTKQFKFIPAPFDPRRDILFRGKTLDVLDKGELLDALCQALVELERKTDLSQFQA